MDEQDNFWTMGQDWALLDQLPKFTVGDDSNAQMFWKQLTAATSILNQVNATATRANWARKTATKVTGIRATM